MHRIRNRVGVQRDREFEMGSWRPGANHRSKKMVKTPDLGKSFFLCISYQFMAKIKKLAWKYRIQSLKIAKMKHFYIFFISEIRIVASSCLKNI